ncbi:insulinase family protein [Bradyrhizobium sp. 83012]|uniref:Insulinase family protein n=1 Tax=Bradyrhizobium aeschynomenes TaxID=2734909 RepID=A0ABX2CQY8_9BRAD|nr:insulinase family protein [Bradyrhizobium aeschynomenes]NPU69702.1 insulinase family protein [Bradyrhizobium aeschynomenes]NPV24643.1 insulinase family protein [Bradyrhizobium aeschynomenes]
MRIKWLATSSPPLRSARAALAALLINVPAYGDVVTSTAISMPTPATFTLSNGMQIVFLRDTRAPVSTLTLWYKAGSADETVGKSGISHFVEHLMFKSSPKQAANTLPNIVHAAGGAINASTSRDYTMYFEHIPSETLPEVMRLEADRMRNLNLTDAAVDSERSVVLEEYNMRVGNRPESRLRDEMTAALYVNHPYGHPVIGWRAEIEAMTRRDAEAYHRRYYSPSNAIAVIAGDMELQDIVALSNATFGKIPGSPYPCPSRQKWPQVPASSALRTITVSDPNVRQPQLRRSFLVPSAASSVPSDAAALEVLAKLLGRGSNSRLYRALVVDNPLATMAMASYNGDSFDQGTFSIMAEPRPGVTFAQVEAEIDRVIADMARTAVTSDDLDRAKMNLVASAIYVQEEQLGMALHFGSGLASGLTVENIARFPSQIGAVSSEQVRAAAQKWLNHTPSVTGYLVKSTSTKTEEKRS